ncbi:hypothetical protein JHK86_034976 [Glycine max]|nr:hypothetical protein JHK86_034976 [Glycine max]
MMREREREQPRERENVRERPRERDRNSERGRLREKQKGRVPGGERERGRERGRKRSLPIAKESHRGRRAEKRRERSRTTITNRGRWRNVICKEELHGGHGARNNDLVENEKWTTVVSRRSLKASQHLSSTGGQPELGGRDTPGNLWTHRQTDGRSIDGGPTGNIQPNVNLQQKSKRSAEAMVDPTTGKDSLGEGPTVTQKEEVYTKRDTANNNQQNDYRHRHHPQGKYLNGEGKDPEEQASIGEEEITAIQYPYPLPLEQNGPNYSKGPLEVKDGCNKEYSFLADHLGMNEGQHHKGGGLSNNTGPLLTEEGCHKEKPRHEAQPLKVCSDKFCKVYSRQKTSSLSRDRIPQMEAQEPSPPHRSFSSADPNDTQTRNQKQNPKKQDNSNVV